MINCTSSAAGVRHALFSYLPKRYKSSDHKSGQNASAIHGRVNQRNNRSASRPATVVWFPSPHSALHYLSNSMRYLTAPTPCYLTAPTPCYLTAPTPCYHHALPNSASSMILAGDGCMQVQSSAQSESRPAVAAGANQSWAQWQSEGWPSGDISTSSKPDTAAKCDWTGQSAYHSDSRNSAEKVKANETRSHQTGGTWRSVLYSCDPDTGIGFYQCFSWSSRDNVAFRRLW